MTQKTATPHATASELAALLRSRAVSALELCDAAIARIGQLDGAVNAVVVRDFDRARDAAREADMSLSRGETRPLLGVPATVKESFDLEGWPTTWGYEVHRSHRAAADAELVRRLKEAGAVILGKTNVPPGLADWQSANPVYGRTVNPYDPARSPGGSSGGSAAALAMGFSAVEIGTDIGGSVRVPAAFCGVYGLKTSHGALSLVGHTAGGATLTPLELSVAGPLARSAEDLEAMLSVLAGADHRDPAWRLDLPPPRTRSMKDFRILLLDRHPVAGVDDAVAAPIAALVEEASRAGCTIRTRHPALPDLAAAHRVYLGMLMSITSWRAPVRGRDPISVHAWFDLLNQQEQIRRRWAQVFRDVDVVLAPVLGMTPFPHTDEPNWRSRPFTINGEAADFGDQLAWAGVATVAGLPAVSAPLGLGPDGLPRAVQIIGPYLEDLTPIAFARLVGRSPPPPAA